MSDEGIIVIDLIQEGVPRSNASWGAQFTEYRRSRKNGSIREKAMALARLYAEPELDAPRRLRPW